MKNGWVTRHKTQDTSKLKRGVCLCVMVTLCFLSLTTTADAATTNQISQFGITWTFDKQYEYGQFCNGDYWVVGPVTIISFNPPSIVSEGRIINGSMINPTVALSTAQGYDDAIYTYTPSLNVAFGVSSGNPLIVPVASSLISTISTVPIAKQKLRTAAVLTVLSAAPPANSFRPPYLGTDKTVKYTADMLRINLLPKLAPVANVPSLTDLERMFERVWLFHCPGWTVTFLVPTENSPDYGRDMCVRLGAGACSLLLNYTDEQKLSLLKKYVQVGIDFYRFVEDGANIYWEPDGGINSGRKLPIIIAGYMLNDAGMLGIGSLGTTEFYFQEDAQTFYVAEENIGKYFTDPYSNPERTHIYGADPETIPGDTVGYTSEHIGMPEWGIKHETTGYWGDARLAFDRVRYGANYRNVNAYSWPGYVLPIHILGLKAVWNHDALFDFMDRYMAATAPGGEWEAGGWRALDQFSENMWDTYRANYGHIYLGVDPVTHQRIYSDNQSTILFGDVSGEGEVSAYDAALTAQAAVGLITLTAEQAQAADVSGEGEVSAYDAALIAQRAVGLISKFPVEP